jgi:hypothetical protein
MHISVPQALHETRVEKEHLLNACQRQPETPCTRLAEKEISPVPFSSSAFLSILFFLGLDLLFPSGLIRRFLPSDLQSVDHGLEEIETYEPLNPQVQMSAL